MYLIIIGKIVLFIGFERVLIFFSSIGLPYDYYVISGDRGPDGDYSLFLRRDKLSL